jgi:hypothetical protein
MTARERNKKLKAMGLSPEIFNKDEYERALDGYLEMQKRIDALENSPEWKDKDFPWKAEREQYKAEHKVPEVPGVEIMMHPAQPWRDQIDDWIKLYRNGFYQFKTILRKSKHYKKALPISRFRDEAAAQGINVDELYDRQKPKD